MADVTFAPDREPSAREIHRFGTIVVVGGGCYGGYYVRQLGRAYLAGAIHWARLLVVDREPACAVRSLVKQEIPPSFDIVTAEWEAFFATFLSAAAADGATPSLDAIVPSPLMPHLMAGWLLSRAQERWPNRELTVAPLSSTPAVPWQRPGNDGTHYVSFADWMCPINCIEPVRCPHTRESRDWSMPIMLRQYADAEAAAGRPLDGPYVLRCLHRAYGVGMLDVREIVEADRAIASRGSQGAASFLIGTVSHCHGALQRIVLGG